MITRKQIKEMVEKKLREGYAEPPPLGRPPQDPVVQTSTAETPPARELSLEEKALTDAIKSLTDDGNIKAADTIKKILALIGNR
jgi:hypothetical protein